MAKTDAEPTVAQQRRRRENCTVCNGWGFVPGHNPMKICECITPTDHSKFRSGAPKGSPSTPARAERP